MSQWGAYGAATSGLSHAQILAHYYPGTTLSSRGEPLLRVHIRADSDDTTEVVHEDGLRVTVPSGSAALPGDIGGYPVDHWRVIRQAGTLAVQGRIAGGWQNVRIGGNLVHDGPATLYTADGRIRLVLGGTHREYRGALRVVGVGPAPGLATVVITTMQSYLRSVVPQEMPASWPQAAVRAQAVAARTYVSFERRANAGRWYDTCDTTACQVFDGVADFTPSGGVVAAYEHPSGNEAVDATAGQLLMYDGRPAFTQFGSANGGWTAAGSMPYLRAFADPYDGVVDSQAHHWSALVPLDRLERAYPSIGSLRTIEVTRRDGNGAWGGRVRRVVIGGSAGAVTVSGEEFRSVTGIRSTWWRLRP
nr:SpoIID/LytB domain-containing protein [Jiangella mangrovi]